MTYISLQYAGITYVPLCIIVVWRHTGISQKCKQVGCRTFNGCSELVCLSVRHGNFKYVFFQVPALCAPAMSIFFDTVVHIEKAVILAQIVAAPLYRKLFCLAKQMDPASLPDGKSVVCGIPVHHHWNVVKPAKMQIEHDGRSAWIYHNVCGISYRDQSHIPFFTVNFDPTLIHLYIRCLRYHVYNALVLALKQIPKRLSRIPYGIR